MSHTIRPTLAEDILPLSDVLTEVHNVDGYPVEGVSDPTGWLTPEGLIAHWTATVDEIPVGHVALCRPTAGDGAAALLLEKGDTPRERIGVVSRLFVSPANRGAGLARLLLTKATTAAEALDLRPTLDVLTKDSAAIGLYTSMGWQPMSIHKHEVEGDDPVDAVAFVAPSDSDETVHVDGPTFRVEIAGRGTTVPQTPDQRFVAEVVRSLRLLSDRQSELLRLARGVDEQSSEVDNATNRAKEFIQERLDDQLDEDGLAKLLDVLQARFLSSKQEGLSDSDRKRALANALEEVLRDLPEGHQGEYLRATARALSVPKSGHFLHNSLLVLLVGELEMFVNEVARACFTRNPEVLKRSEQSLRWGDISTHESIVSVRDSLVDRAIEDVMRGPLVEWMDFFRKTFHIPAIEAATTYSAQEALQRRHCIVHNAGTASNLYTKKLEKFSEHTIHSGENLEVNSEYLRSAADSILEIAYSLAWAAGATLCRDELGRTALFEALGDVIYDLLQRQRLEVVVRITREAPIDKLPEGTGLIMKVNRWVAHKELGKLESVRKEIEEFNTSTRSRNFQLAKLALLDKHVEALDLAGSMLISGDLSRAHYLTWPLLRGVRAHEREQRKTNPVDQTDQPD